MNTSTYQITPVNVQRFAFNMTTWLRTADQFICPVLEIFTGVTVVVLFCLFSVALRPNTGHGLLILEVS